MFDNLNKQGQDSSPAQKQSGNNFPLQPDKKQIEDIFSATEAPQKPQIFQPKQPAKMESSSIPDTQKPQDGLSGPKTPTSPVGLNFDGSNGPDFPPMESPAVNQNIPQAGANSKKLILIGAIVVVVVIIIFVVLVLANSALNKSDEVEIKDEPVDETPIIQEKEEPIVVEEEKDLPTIDPIEDNTVFDEDNDGLTDEEEKDLGTDLDNVDTDGDGLFDREEVKVYKTDPLNPDTDGDGHNDGDEAKSGYNPKGEGRIVGIPESIQDSIPNTNIDTDGDGLFDSEEEENKTDINKIDTDGDELSDYEEIKAYFTDPLNPDTDGDGYKDGDEVANGYSPLGK